MRIFLLILTAIFINTAYGEEIKTKIVDVQNIYFMFYSGKEYKEIFRTPDKSLIYGYGLLSNDKALFAYQDPKFTAAVAIIIVIDTNTGKTIFTKNIGDAGETSFDFSAETGRGVFNDSEGLKIIQIMNNNVIIHPVSGVKAEHPYAPFWVNSVTIGYYEFVDDKPTFETIEVP